MRIDEQLKKLLAEHLRRIIEGWKQCDVAAVMYVYQPDISALRRGRPGVFSVGRLFRLIARNGYDIEIHLRTIPNRFAAGRQPTVTVTRYDRFGRPEL